MLFAGMCFLFFSFSRVRFLRDFSFLICRVTFGLIVAERAAISLLPHSRRFRGSREASLFDCLEFFVLVFAVLLHHCCVCSLVSVN